MSSTLLDARQVTRRYGPRTVLEGIDLRVNVGDRIGLIGPNGAGKSPRTTGVSATSYASTASSICSDNRPRRGGRRAVAPTRSLTEALGDTPPHRRRQGRRRVDCLGRAGTATTGRRRASPRTGTRGAIAGRSLRPTSQLGESRGPRSEADQLAWDNGRVMAGARRRARHIHRRSRGRRLVPRRIPKRANLR